MGYAFMDIARTPGVKTAQAENGSAAYFDDFSGDRQFDRFTAAEQQFISERDSFYMATVSETGWPYMQHRGGPPGFLRVIDDRTLDFADFRGNRQYISIGNLKTNERAALFLMDYAGRRRLKIYARLETRSLAENPALAKALADPGYRAKIERVVLVHLEAFDWNCPQHITPRFTESEVARGVEPLHLRIRELEEENARLRARAKDGGSA